MTIPAILTEKLSKTYLIGNLKKKRVHALTDLDLTISPGQVYGLLGPNGAGKSTTIKLVLNLIRPSSGLARIFGHAPDSVEARSLVGFLPENPAPYEYLTGEEFVTFAGQLGGLSGGDLRAQVSAVIEQVAMGGAKDLQIRRYSKGMIQRISLAQAVVNRPKLLILDEPTSGLDVLGRQLIRDIILEQRKLGTTIVFCSHIIPDVEALSDQVAVLIGGRLVKQGSVSSLLADESALTEISLEGLSGSVEGSLATLFKSCERMGSKVIVRCDERDVRHVLSETLSTGARLVYVQRTKYSLEDLFLKAMKDSGRSVGSDIS
jgi:ABC-2 type transport system ATP-binding protein